MQEFAPKAKEYIKKQMRLRGLTYTCVAEGTDTSVDTLKNFLTGKTSKNPGFEPVMSWIIFVGDIYECLGIEPPTKPDSQNVAEIKELCDKRIADIKEMCEERIEDIRKDCELRILDLKEAQAEFIKMIMSAK